jgi:rhodanese-related sulfurtransferase
MPKYITLIIIFMSVALASNSEPAQTADIAPMITKEALNEILANDDLIILDVRAQPDWRSSEFKIKNAMRVDPDDFESWGDLFPKNKLLVLY